MWESYQPDCALLAPNNRLRMAMSSKSASIGQPLSAQISHGRYLSREIVECDTA
jgi:hypothetical protein